MPLFEGNATFDGETRNPKELLSLPDTTELPKTENEKKTNLEKFRQYGFIIDPSIEKAFVTLKTTYFYKTENGIVSSARPLKLKLKTGQPCTFWTRLVPIFDRTQAGGKTIEELNAKIYTDNADKVVAKKWKGGYVGVIEKGKIVYKSRKSINFSIPTSQKETYGTLAAQQQKEPMPQPTQIRQTQEDAIVSIIPESIVQDEQATPPLTAEPIKTGEVLSESTQLLSDILDTRNIAPSDYPLLNQVTQHMQNKSSPSAKIIEITKPSGRYLITDHDVYDMGAYINLASVPSLTLGTDTNGRSMTIVYDFSSKKFSISFSPNPAVERKVQPTVVSPIDEAKAKASQPVPIDKNDNSTQPTVKKADESV